MKALLLSRKFHLTLGWAISLVLLFWVFSKVEWNQIESELRSADLFYLLPLSAILILHLLLRALRWRYILPGAAKNVPFGELHGALMIGNLASNLLPLRAGEFIRPYIFSRRTEYSFFQSFLSVILERFFDLVTVLLGFALIVPWVPGIPTEAFQVAVLFSAVAGLIFLGVILAAFFPVFCESLAVKFLRFVPGTIRQKLSTLITNSIESAKVVRPIKQILATLFLTVLVWGTCVFYYILALQMFGVPESLLPGVAVTVIIALGVAAPSAPGFLGVYEASTLAALSLFAVKEEVAIAIAIVTHAHQFLYVCAVGAVLLIKRNLSLASLREVKAVS